MIDINDRLQKLGAMVREQTEQGPDTEHSLRLVKNRLRLTARTAPNRHIPRAYLAFSVSLLVASVALVFTLFRGENAPLSVALESQESHLVGTWVQSKSETKQLRFSDGTLVALSPETSVSVQETTQFGGTVIVGQGRARAEIVHLPKARWTFVAGPFHVRVTGTEFDLGWDPGSETLELALHQGSVELSGPTLSKPRQVRKGEFIRLQLSTRDAADDHLNVARASEQGDTQDPDPATTGTNAEKREGSLPPKSEADNLSSASVQTLWDLSQNARLSGRPTVARDALLALRAQHGTRGQTAFLLGKIHADQLQNGTEAIRWFQTYLKEVPNGSLSEQAWGRLIELQAGTEAGKQMARSYLSRYPNGSYETLARRSLQ